MDKPIDIETFLSDKVFKKQVIPFFQQLNPSFIPYQQHFEAVFSLHHSLNLVVFLLFIPRNEPTSLPTPHDSFQDITTRPRISTGEWVVESIFEVKQEKMDYLMENISKHQEKPVSFFRKTMY